LAYWLLPTLPKAGECKDAFITPADEIGLLPSLASSSGFKLLPLVEPRAWHQASSPAQGCTKCGFRGCLFRTGVYHRIANTRVFGPPWDKPPAKKIELTRISAIEYPDQGPYLRRCDVEPWSQRLDRDKVKLLGQLLFSRGRRGTRWLGFAVPEAAGVGLSRWSRQPHTKGGEKGRSRLHRTYRPGTNGAWYPVNGEPRTVII